MIRINFQARYAQHKLGIEKQLASLADSARPSCVYDPIQYVLNAGGKRVRALLVLLACEAVGGKPRQALHAACAVEILHNFTLVHDDVMDNSSLRRGRATVHTKWDTNIAILSGDAMVAYAYRSLLKTKSANLDKAVHEFTDAFIQVCEGQGFDKEFETRSDVTLEEYLLMINKKTARVIASACAIGALVGNGSTREVAALTTFGEALGMAFQIQDDVLDITATEVELGKPIGGDVKEGKKTYLLLKALMRANAKERAILQAIVRKKNVGSGIVQDALAIYERTGALHDAQQQVSLYTAKAQNALMQLQPGKAREMLLWLSQQLLERNS